MATHRTKPKHRSWPMWRYGPDGASGVFNSAEEVPEGWYDHPSKVPPPAPPKRGRPKKTVDAPSPLDDFGVDRDTAFAELAKLGVTLDKTVSDEVLAEALTEAFEDDDGK